MEIVVESITSKKNKEFNIRNGLYTFFFFFLNRLLTLSVTYIFIYKLNVLKNMNKNKYSLSLELQCIEIIIKNKKYINT